MSSEERILHRIVKASDAIRKKHRMLKRGKEAIETSMKEVFKPIITPLQEMADRTPAQPNTVKEEVPSIKQELPVEDEEEEASTMRGDDDLMSFQSAASIRFPHSRRVHRLYTKRLTTCQSISKCSRTIKRVPSTPSMGCVR